MVCCPILNINQLSVCISCDVYREGEETQAEGEGEEEGQRAGPKPEPQPKNQGVGERSLL